MTPPHSPLPWTVNDYGDIVDSNGKVVVDTAGIYVRRDRDYIAFSATNYEKMRKALEEYHRLALVIESAVRHADLPNHAAVLAAIKQGRAALAGE